MKKLFTLREWLTLEEAARHLSLVLEEEVTVAEVLRLGLDGHLTLSVDFVNHAKAHLGRVVPFRDLPMMELPPVRDDGKPGSEPMLVPDGLLIDEVEAIAEDTRFVHFERVPQTIDGVWDLTMVGGERLDTEHRFQLLTEGPPVELININGTFVCNEEGVWAELLSRFEDRLVDTPAGKKKIRGEYYPAAGLPSGANLVVRTGALSDFTSALSKEERDAKKDPGSLATRERDTLLKLVIGMALEGYKYDPNKSRSPTPAEIVGDLAKHGIEVSDDTVRKYLKEAAATVLSARPRKT